MGKGKKKADPSQYATTKIPSKYANEPAVLAAKAAVTEAEPDTTKVQDKKPKKASEEAKSAPVQITVKKVTALPKEDDPLPTDPVIALNPDEEDRAVDVVKQFWSTSFFDTKEASTFELETAYETLIECGFEQLAVESAIEIAGADVDIALEWLLLNVDHSKLPPRWSARNLEATVKAEEQKLLPKQDLSKLKPAPKVILKKRDIVVAEDLIEKTERERMEYQALLEREKEVAKVKRELIKARNKGKADEEARLEARMDELRMGRPSIFSNRDDSRVPQVLLTDTTSDPPGELPFQIDEEAAGGTPDKISGSEILVEVAQSESATDLLRRALGDDIQSIQMKSAGKMSDSELIVQSDAVEPGKSDGPRVASILDENDDDVVGGFFGDAETWKPSQEGAQLPVQRLQARVRFEGLIPKSHKGATPKSLLASILKRKSWDDAKFLKANSDTNVGVRISCGDVLVGIYTTNLICASTAIAEEVAALRAIYELFASEYRAIDIQLPSDFRDLWREWVKDDTETQLRAAEAHARPRREFVEKFLASKTASKATQSYSSISGVPNENTTLNDNLRLKSRESPKWKVDALKETLSSTKRMDTSSLPIYNIRSEVVEASFANDFIVVVGETGSGKTTQVPQFVLDAWVDVKGIIPRVAIAEPRRVSATSVSRRVGEELGDHSLVAYSIRGESTITPKSCLLFCTTGVLLRKAQEDPLFSEYNTIVVDEVHERTLDADVLLVLIKRAVLQRRAQGLEPLKCIAMSATINFERLSEYFGGCPVLRSSGRAFFVQTMFLEDVIEASGYDAAIDDENVDDYADDQSGPNGLLEKKIYDETKVLSERTIKSLSKIDEARVNHALIVKGIRWAIDNAPQARENGAVLVFLPGLRDIQTLQNMLESTMPFADEKKFMVLALHSSLSNPDQLRKVFEVPPKRGPRKVVLSTNIAETGVTIPDVTVVIDTCRVNEVSFNEKRGLALLTERFCSRASAEQRAGRAGRVQEGICLRLVTEERFRNRMEQHARPEMGRVPLDQVCLSVLAQQLDPREFFPLALDPPNPDSIKKALARLNQLGAVRIKNGSTDLFELTPLGKLVARLPLDARIGKIVVIGSLLGCSGNTICSVAACASADKSFFRTPEKRRLFKYAVADSDILTETLAFMMWDETKNGSNQFAREHGLDVARLVELRAAKSALLLCAKSELGLKNTGTASSHSMATKNELRLLTAALCSGSNIACFTPTRARLELKPSQVVFACSDGLEASLIQSSIASGPGRGGLRQGTDGPRSTRLFAYGGRMRTSRVFLTDLTPVQPIAVALFGKTIKPGYRSRRMGLDGGWIGVRCVPRTCALVTALRRVLEQVMEDVFADPSKVSHGQSVQVVRVVLDLLLKTE